MINCKELIRQIEYTSPGILTTLKAKIVNISANSVTFRILRMRDVTITLDASDTYSIQLSKWNRKALAWVCVGLPRCNVFCDEVGTVMAEMTGVAIIQAEIRDTVKSLRAKWIAAKQQSVLNEITM